MFFSIFSPFLYINIDIKTVNEIIKIQSKIPHQVLYGIILPFNEYAVVNTEIILQTVIISIK